MKTKILFAALFGAALSVASLDARADGMAVKTAQLPAEARASLLQQIAADKAANPDVYTAVRSVRGVHREAYMAENRNPIPNAGKELRALGPAATLALIEAIAFDAPSRAGLSDDEWAAYQYGALEALGLLRDARSGAVLRAAFDGAQHPKVQRAAAEAMGRLCGDAELASLTKLAVAAGTADSGRRLAAIAGLGECKRVESAKHLAALLPAAQDEATAQAVAAALGSVGSSWAWKAMGPQAQATGDKVREIAATALVGGFVRQGGAARLSTEKALLLVEHPSTHELIARAKPSADVETRAALEALEKRVAKRIPR